MEKKSKDHSFTGQLLDKAGALIRKGMSKMDDHPEEKNLADVAELQKQLKDLEARHEQLQKEKALQDQIIYNISDGFFIIDQEGKMLVVNDALCVMTGFSREEMINLKPPYPYWPEEELENIGEAFRQKFNKEASSFKLIFKRKNEERFSAILETNDIEDADGKITHCFATIRDLSKLEKAFQKVEESRQKYEDLYERTSDCIYKTTPDGKVVRANPALVKMLGFESEEELKKVTITKDLYFDPNERQKILDEKLETYRLKRKDGSEVWVEDQGYFTKDENGKVIFHEGILRDITDRKRAEDELRKSELALRAKNDLLQSILDSPKDIFIFSLDTDYCYKAFSTSHQLSVKKNKGVDIEIGMSIMEINPDPSNWEKVKVNIDRTLQGEQLVFIEKYSHNNRFESYWENRYSPIYAEDGSITGLTVFMMDVSARMLDQQKLSKSEKALKEAQKLSKTGSWEMDLRDGSLEWSEELYRIFELENIEKEQLYQAFQNRVYKEDAPLLNEKIKNLIEKGESYVIEHRIYTKGDDLKHVLCKGEPLFNEQEEVIGIRGVTLDITEKKAQEKLIEQNLETLNQQNNELHRLIESNVKLENFAYIASHDLRSPVRTMNSFTGLLKSRAGNKLDEEEMKFLDFIAKGARDIQGLIDDMLAYSKVKSKGFNATGLNVKDLLQNLLATLSADIRENNARVSILEVPDVIWGDRIKLWQVFQNLILNAMKFHTKGSSPVVTISGETTEQEWIFEIRDNGIGIDPEFHEKIFVLFRQLNTKDEFDGTGLGLAICKKIIEQHKGRIWVESEPDQGATFFFALPRVSDNHETLGIG
ncbi:MAG: PAS domain S-box protein [Bacteroidetes bacterium]|nr:MAG: PAS domain S-box protein [Bacteroidota bacterium]